ncbi:MAG TPA: hypothetical protein VN709_03965 [Terriglobales bacterium]|nr:hypothetical protein [Terriglobales bacterium]
MARKSSSWTAGTRPGLRLDSLAPGAALPGGEFTVHGADLVPERGLPRLRVGGQLAPLILAAPAAIMARVPERALSGQVEMATDDGAVAGPNLVVAVQIADNLHPVCNPALDPEGNIWATLSGTRGQKTPVSIYRIDANYTVSAWSSALTNPSGLAFDREGTLFASSRHDGAVYRLAANGTATLHAGGLGIATGIAFDSAGDLYVGDRSGTIFKIDAQRSTFVFATLEPSVAAYHLAFGPDNYLYVSGPTTSSFDAIWRISPSGEVSTFFRGLGRPQGIAFDANGDLYAVASHAGRCGVIRITPAGVAECVLSGHSLVGLAFAPALAPAPAAPGSSLILATHNALFHVPWPTAGRPLPPA